MCNTVSLHVRERDRETHRKSRQYFRRENLLRTEDWGREGHWWDSEQTSWLTSVGIVSPGLGNYEPERMTLGQSLARTDKFLSAVKPFYRSRNKELRVYGKESAYGVKTWSVNNISSAAHSKWPMCLAHNPFSQATSLVFIIKSWRLA